MKKFTNHTPGLRGINTAEGTVWIEPGETASIDADTIVGALPDLGKAGDAPAFDRTELDALKDQVAALTKQVDDLTKDKAALTKQVDDLTAPKK